MKMPQRYSNLSYHKSRLFLLEPSYLDQMAEKLATFDKIHQKENSELILENVIHAYNERMVNFIQDFLFKLQTLHRVIFKDDIFSYTFHCVNFFRFYMLTLENFTKSALSDYFD